MDSVKALVKYKRKKGHIVPEEDDIIAHFWGALHKGLTNLEQTNFYLPHLGTFVVLLKPLRKFEEYAKTDEDKKLLKEIIEKREKEIEDIKKINNVWAEKYSRTEEDLEVL